MSWFAANGKSVDWHANDASLTCLYGAPDVDEDPDRQGRHVMLFVHGGTLPRDFVVPELARSILWKKFIDTAAEPPDDIYPNRAGRRCRAIPSS